MTEGDLPGVQAHPLILRSQGLNLSPMTTLKIHRVTHNRPPNSPQMDTDLMRSSSDRPNKQQAGPIVAAFDNFDFGPGFQPL